MKISNTISNVIAANSIVVNNRVYELKKQGKDIIVLSLGEAFFDLQLKDFDKLPYPDIYHYSHSRGIPELRSKIATLYKEHYRCMVNSDEQLLITAGSKIAIYMAFLAILEYKSEVIIPEPYWVSYTEQVKLCSGVPVCIPYDVSVFDYEKYITDKTKIIVINNPNNPSGKVYSKEELEHVHKLAKKYNIYILSDEAYSDFVVNANEFLSMGIFDPEYTHTIIANSLSKNLGMSGWRLGYIISNSNLINTLLKINQHLITCPPTILEYYVSMYFDQIIAESTPQIKAVVKKRNKLAEYIKSIEIDYLPGTATFYFLVSLGSSRLQGSDFALKLLNEFNVATVPGVGYGNSCKHFIRVSVGAEPWDRIIKGVNAIKELIQKTT